MIYSSYVILMVSRAARYYGTPFKVHQGVNQGVPISPTIFNMVVDAVQTSVNKKVGMVCHPCYIFGGHSEVEYTHSMTGVGPSFWE